MIIYLDAEFRPVDDESQAEIAKVIPEDGEPPYFVVASKLTGERKGDGTPYPGTVCRGRPAIDKTHGP